MRFSMVNRIGIDIGSKAVKVVVLADNGSIYHSLYRRHHIDIRTTLNAVLHDLSTKCGDISGSIAITGSAGIELAAHMNVPFVHEVIATSVAVQSDIPQADAIIEIGGEDSKIVYLSGAPEQRMNASCAGGTGGFIDTIAYMLGVSPQDMGILAQAATRTYPIASRCAVFAQVDVRPLLNAGARKADIASSVLEAVVKQTISGLACGRPMRGRIVFLGGPFEFLPALADRFRDALGLDRQSGIKPPNAHFFTAKGAALLSCDTKQLGMQAIALSLSELKAMIGAVRSTDDNLPRLPPLFESEAAYLDFKTRHNKDSIGYRPFPASGSPLFLGIDAGSTAIKIVAIDNEGHLVYSGKHATKGNVLKSTSTLLVEFYQSLPKGDDGGYLHSLAHTCATGYGEDLLITALRVDSGVVETTAHFIAARQLDPDVSFILDIGGQDIKALWIHEGVIDKAVLNEACSSGCGSFIEGTAHSLSSSPWGFSNKAVKAMSPIDLGTRCTVFMTSRVKHAQKIGASHDDIAAGIAYSIVNNALFKTIGIENLNTMGNNIVVQGGVFLSDAVLRAFELTAGRHVRRSDSAQFMGAYGAALIARSRAENPMSSLIGKQEMEKLVPQYRIAVCPGCNNTCKLSIATFANNGYHSWDHSTRKDSDVSIPEHERDMTEESTRYFVSGNKCSRAYEFIGSSIGHSIEPPPGHDHSAPDMVSFEQELIAQYSDQIDINAEKGSRSAIKVGLIHSLHGYENLPFWHTLFTSLGFSVLVAQDMCEDAKAMETIPSESVCYPAKLAHLCAITLVERGATALFIPEYERGSRCPVSSHYARVINSNVPQITDGALALVSPHLSHIRPEDLVSHEFDRKALLAAVQGLAPSGQTIQEDEINHALDEALAEQGRFMDRLHKAGSFLLAQLEKEGGRGIVLAGRPYHIDSRITHGINRILSSLGFMVFTPLSLEHLFASDSSSPPFSYKGNACTEDRYRSDQGRLGSMASWKRAGRMIRSASFVADHAHLNMVALQSFGCSFDAINTMWAQSIVEASGHLFASYKIDEIVDTTHLRIRLRTLADAIDERKHRFHKDAISRTPTPPNSFAPESSMTIGRIEREDIDVGRIEVSQDICTTVSSLAGCIIRCCRKDPSLRRIIVPTPCKACLFDALPALVQKSLGFSPEIILAEDSGQLCASEPSDKTTGRLSSSSSIKIGLLGNPFMVFEPEMNDHVAEFLTSQGCVVVFPEIHRLITDDIRYIDQLERFVDQLVDHVLYIQSFGCLKGHIDSRGALRTLEKEFPHLPITVLDYDPNASMLNRMNRILLVLAALKTSGKRAS